MFQENDKTECEHSDDDFFLLVQKSSLDQPSQQAPLSYLNFGKSILS